MCPAWNRTCPTLLSMQEINRDFSWRLLSLLSLLTLYGSGALRFWISTRDAWRQRLLRARRLSFVITAILLFKRNKAALHFYALFVLATLGWAVWEVGLDWWQLGPRGGLIIVIGIWLLMPWIRKPLGFVRPDRHPVWRQRRTAAGSRDHLHGCRRHIDDAGSPRQGGQPADRVVNSAPSYGNTVPDNECTSMAAQHTASAIRR